MPQFVRSCNYELRQIRRVYGGKPWQRKKQKKPQKRNAKAADSAINRSSHKKLPRLAKLTFLRQSWQSNLCGVYSTGIFLSAFRVVRNKKEARELFGLGRSTRAYSGTETSEVLEVISRMNFIRSPRWTYLKRFQPERINRVFQAAVPNGFPTILFFSATQKSRRRTAGHFSVITSTNQKCVTLFDPLGHCRNSAQVRISSCNQQRIRTQGIAYQARFSGEVAILGYRLR